MGFFISKENEEETASLIKSEEKPKKTNSELDVEKITARILGRKHSSLFD